jgi:hypothetical protein
VGQRHSGGKCGGAAAGCCRRSSFAQRWQAAIRRLPAGWSGQIPAPRLAACREFSRLPCTAPVTLFTASSQDAERIESGKAAAAAAAAGALASLPIAAAGGGTLGGLLALGAAGLASALLGVTYRYAVRQDTGNLQLKVRTLRLLFMLLHMRLQGYTLLRRPGALQLPWFGLLSATWDRRACWRAAAELAAGQAAPGAHGCT